MITLEEAVKANDYIRDNADKIAEARAHRLALEDFKRAQVAILYQQAPGDTVASKEAWAFSHADYKQLLDGLKIARKEDIKYLHLVDAAKQRVEIWRTIQANERAGVVY